MIRRLLILDGVSAVCAFRDDGSFVDGYGLMTDEQMQSVTAFAHGYRRMVQGYSDQLSILSQLSGWTPPQGWVIRGKTNSLCCVGNIVCVAETALVDLNDLLLEMREVSRW